MKHYIQIFVMLVLLSFAGTTVYALGCEELPTSSKEFDTCPDECLTVKWYDMDDNLVDMSCKKDGADSTDECEENDDILQITKKKWNGDCDGGNVQSRHFRGSRFNKVYL